MKYRKKPVIVEAHQWTGANEEQMRQFAGAHFGTVDPEDRDGDITKTAQVFDVLHSTWIGVYTGQWIIKGTAGEFYPCADEQFRKIYEPVDAGNG